MVNIPCPNGVYLALQQGVDVSIVNKQVLGVLIFHIYDQELETMKIVL
jgi:hypothetical protein